MLCLTRRRGEKVIIGDREGVVTLLEILDDKVRLGFEFPKDVGVHREEIFLKIEAEQRDDKSKGTDSADIGQEPG